MTLGQAFLKTPPGQLLLSSHLFQYFFGMLWSMSLVFFQVRAQLEVPSVYDGVGFGMCACAHGGVHGEMFEHWTHLRIHAHVRKHHAPHASILSTLCISCTLCAQSL